MTLQSFGEHEASAVTKVGNDRFKGCRQQVRIGRAQLYIGWRLRIVNALSKRLARLCVTVGTYEWGHWLLGVVLLAKGDRDAAL